MAQCGAHEGGNQDTAGLSKDSSQQEDGDSDIEVYLFTWYSEKTYTV